MKAVYLALGAFLLLVAVASLPRVAARFKDHPAEYALGGACVVAIELGAASWLLYTGLRPDKKDPPPN